MENKLVDGLYVDKPSESAPDFVKGKISINAKLIDFYNAHKNDAGYVNIDILESKGGKYYAKLNDFKPNNSSGEPEPDDLPF